MSTSPWILGCVLSLALWPPCARAQTASRIPSVLMLFSSRSTAPVVPTIETAFRRALEDRLGAAVDFHVEYLDLPDETVVPYANRLTDLLREKYAGQTIDLVVVQRAEALSFLLENRSALFPSVPIVFVDVTPAELERLQPPADVTGAVRIPEGQRTVDVALALRPGTQQVVIVGGASRFDRGAAQFAEGLVHARAPGLKVVSLVGLPLDEQLQRIANLPGQSVAIFTSYRADVRGRSMVARDVLRIVARTANAPTFGAADTWLGYGIVGGDLIQYSALAERAAGLATRFFKGEPISSLAPIAEPSSALMFDWRELRRWGIDERLVPAGSIIRFREETVWSRYKAQITAAGALLVGQGLLIGTLLVERRTRRRAQTELTEAEQRYRTIADFTADWEYWTHPSGSLLYVSPSCSGVTGYSAAELSERPGLLTDMIVEEDRASWLEHRRRAVEVAGPSTLQFRIRTKSGETRWIDHVCSPVTGEGGRDLGIRGSNRDITARKQSEEELRRALDEIEALRERLEIDNTYLREQLQPDVGIEGIIGTTDVMRYVVSKVQQVAPTSSTVLLLGETGVGKSLVAQAIHDLSPRRNRPLVTLNCAALPASLVESELFGHERGAFTGAQTRRAGRFEIANAGTLFLDEIGDLPLDLQGKLLRAVQDGEFERVGSNVTLKTDVRLIAATNRKLDDDVRAGRFRQDLWYRLNVFPITVPPLRQRIDDIPALTNHFVEKHCRKLGRQVLQVSKATMKALQARNWPGNIRELENVVERAVISSRGSMFETSDWIPDLMPVEKPEAPQGVQTPTANGLTLEQIERDHIVSTLERLHWRVEGEGGAADVLGINASTLRSRMRKLNIRRPGSRPLVPSA